MEDLGVSYEASNGQLPANGIDGIPDRGSVKEMLARGDRRLRRSVEKAPPLDENEWLNAAARSEGDGPRPVAPNSSFGVAAKDRLLVAHTISHFPADGSQPTATGGSYSRSLDTVEQCYVRKTTVGESWQPLPDGWLKRVGLLMIGNGRVKFTAQPTPEERTAAEARILEVGIVVGESSDAPSSVQPFAIVRPGESIGLEPTDLTALRLRCRRGEAHIVVSMFPS